MISHLRQNALAGLRPVPIAGAIYYWSTGEEIIGTDIWFLQSVVQSRLGFVGNGPCAAAPYINLRI